MTLPIFYRGRTERSFVNYDFFDIASGQGYEVFYGGRLSDGSTSGAHVLNSFLFNSQDVVSAAEVTSGTYVSVRGPKFNILFNSTRTVNGTVYISLPVGMVASSGSTVNSFGLFANITIYRVDVNGTETSLGTTTTEVFQQTAGSVDNVTPTSKIIAAKISLTNETFKEGETFRLFIDLQGKSDGTDSSRMGLSHSPYNRNDDSVAQTNGSSTAKKIIADATDTRMLCLIPFKIDQ